MADEHVSYVPPRPRQALMAAVLLALFGVLGLLAALLLWGSLRDDASHGQDVSSGLYAIVALQALVSTAQIASGVWVFVGRSWARTLAIAICVVNLLGAILSLASGAILQAVLALALNIALIRVLMSEDVREWCR